MSVEILTVSTKGQIVIPKKLRKQMGMGAGTRIAAYSNGDAIMLKPIQIPTESDFVTWLDEAQQWARNAGYQEDDVDAIIAEVRSRKKVGA